MSEIARESGVAGRRPLRPPRRVDMAEIPPYRHIGRIRVVDVLSGLEVPHVVRCDTSTGELTKLRTDLDGHFVMRRDGERVDEETLRGWWRIAWVGDPPLE